MRAPLRHLLAVTACAAATSLALAESERERMARGFATLRAMDCARCHGGNYTGQSGPSLLEAVREGTRERFDRYVLEGDIVRGMPGYRGQARVVADLDAMYAYLSARARGAIGPGNFAP